MPKYFKQDISPYDRIYTPSKCQELLLPPIQSMSQCQLSSNAFGDHIKTLDFDFCCACNISKGEIFQFLEPKNQICFESKNQKCLEVKNQMCLEPNNSKIYLESCKLVPLYVNEDNQKNDILNSQGTQTLTCFNKEKNNIPLCGKSSFLFNINDNDYEVADTINKDTIDESNVPCQFSVTLKEDNDELYNTFDNESYDGIDYYVNDNEYDKHEKYINVQCKPNELKIVPKQVHNNDSKINLKQTTNEHSSSNLNFEDENIVNKGMKHIEIESNRCKFHLNGANKECRELCFEVNVDAQLKKNTNNHNFESNSLSTNESNKSQPVKNDNFRNKNISTKEILVSKPYFEIKNKWEPKKIDDNSVSNTNTKSAEKNINGKFQDMQKYLKEIPRKLDKKKFYIAKKNDFEDDFYVKEVGSLSNGYQGQIDIDCECKIVNAPQLQIDTICKCNVVGKPEAEVKQNCICHNLKSSQLQTKVDHNGKELNINGGFNCTNQNPTLSTNKTNMLQYQPKKCPKETFLKNDANTSQSKININHNDNTLNYCSNFSYTDQNPLILEPKSNLLHYQSAKCADEIVPKIKNLIKDPLQNPMDPLLSPIDPLCLNLCYTHDSGR